MFYLQPIEAILFLPQLLSQDDQYSTPEKSQWQQEVEYNITQITHLLYVQTLMFRDNSDLGDGGGGGRGEERDQLHHSGATLDTDLESLALTEVTMWLVLINIDIDTVR